MLRNDMPPGLLTVSVHSSVTQNISQGIEEQRNC